MKYIIDRFEGNFAIVELENGNFIDIPKEAIPKEAKESDIINITIDKEDTAKRKADIRKLENEIFKD